MGILDYESLTVSDSPLGITGTLIDQHHNYALITCETAAVRFRIDGEDPTSSEGHVLDPGDVLQLEGSELAAFRAIRRDSTDAVLKVSTGSR